MLLVTHRPELAAQADVVWCLEAGCLVSADQPRRTAGAGLQLVATANLQDERRYRPRRWTPRASSRH